MNVSFWFDPVCPFCWMTSRWINSVAPERDLQIDWQPISLLFKNNPPPDSPFYAPTVRTRDLLRVVESVRAGGHADRIGQLYTEFGRRIHHDKALDFDVAAILNELELDATHAQALTQESFDDEIRARMAVGLDLTGADVGTPLLAVPTRDGGRVGLFGPVITTYPEAQDATALWDSFVIMASYPGFFELKRTRTGRPDLPPLSASPG